MFLPCVRFWWQLGECPKVQYLLYQKNIETITCDINTFPDVQMRQSRTVEEGHGEAGVVQGGALGHVQVRQVGRRGRARPWPRYWDGGDHGTAWNVVYLQFGLRKHKVKTI